MGAVGGGLLMGAPRAAAQDPVPGGRLVQGLEAEFQSLNPILAFDAFSEIVWSNFYLRLLEPDPETGVASPGLAETVETSADGKTVTFTLREGLVWSDGEPFTGEDYQYTVEAIARSEQSFRKQLVMDIVGAREYAAGQTDSISGLAVGNGGRTITVELNQAMCAAVDNLGTGMGGILPKHHFITEWDNRTTDTSGNIDNSAFNLAPPASMGPFVFNEFRPGVDVAMTRNDRYYRGAPLLEEHIVKIYADASAVKAALLSGELSFARVAAADVEEIQQSDRPLNFLHQDGVDDYNFIGWNTQSAEAPWLGSKEVRQALMYGLNRQALVEQIHHGFAQVVFSPITPPWWAYGGADLNPYEYDPERAAELLDLAGSTMGDNGVRLWTDGQPMRMQLNAVAGARALGPVVEIAQQQYGELGIAIEPNLMSFPAFVEAASPLNDALQGTVFGFTPDPEVAYNIWHSSAQGEGGLNFVHYENEVVDEALEAARFGPDCSPEARKEAFTTFNQQVNEDVPYTFLFLRDLIYFSDESLQNFRVNRFNTALLWNVEQWWIQP
jgi:peptide/nickel transport system substrate-binding protein